MKKLSRILALILVFAILCPMAAYALPYDETIVETSRRLNEAVTIYSGAYSENGSRFAEYYAVYEPDELVQPAIVYGSKLCNYGNFETMAALLENRGLHVVCGINGDYYNTATYQPLGIVISEGRLISSDAGHWAVGFREDGTAFIDKPTLEYELKMGNRSYILAGFNKDRDDIGFYLYNSEYSYTTKASASGTDLILIPDDKDMQVSVNCEMSFTVAEKIEKAKGTELKEGQFVLSLSDKADDWKQSGMRDAQVGDEIKISISCDEIWNEAVCAIGSLYKLVTDGKTEEGLENREKAPRTAVGIREDGSVVLYVMDGRKNAYSSGFTIAELAERMKELGCVEACIMDGGGSTNMQALFAGNTEDTPINQPVYGERSVSNYIMLVINAEESDGKIKNLSLAPDNVIMLPETSVQFEVKAADRAMYPVELQDGCKWSSDIGDIDSDGMFTAGRKIGEGTVTAKVKKISADALVKVIDSPSEISIVNEGTGKKINAINLEPGEGISIAAKASYFGFDVISQDESYEWKLTGEIGEVDEEGNLRASKSGQGKLTVSCGKCSVSVDVSVAMQIEVLEDFENFSAKNGNLKAQTPNDNFYVKYGHGSAEVSYDLESAAAILPLDIETELSYASVWVYGDGSGNTLYLQNGETEQPLTTLDFYGWKQMIFETEGYLQAFVISGSGSGKIYLDQLLGVSENYTDNEAPQIRQIDENEFEVYDNYGIYDLSVSANGKKLSSHYQDNVLRIDELPQDGKSYIVKISARDISGNIACLTAETAGYGEAVFEDMEGHWAETYVKCLAERGLVSGVEQPSGKFAYLPDKSMTRAEFAAIISRWLGTDIEAYENTELPFEDEIAEWAEPYVKAVYAEGIIKGSTVGGKLYFNGGETITRAQVMTIIGRTKERGYSGECSFSDGDTVPDWAKPYIEEMAAQGIVSGAVDGGVHPNDAVTRAQAAKLISLS